MICKQCGQEVPDGVKFCTNCGYPMMEAESPAPENVPVNMQNMGEPVPMMVPPVPGDPDDEAPAEVPAPKNSKNVMGLRFLYAAVLGMCLHEISVMFMQSFMNAYGQNYAYLSQSYIYADRLVRILFFLAVGTVAYFVGKAKKQKAGAIILLILTILLAGAAAVLGPQAVKLVEMPDRLELVPFLGLNIGLGSAVIIAILIGVLGRPRKLWIYLIIMLGSFVLMGGFVFIWSYLGDMEVEMRAQGLLIEWISMDFFALAAMPMIGLAGGWVRQASLDAKAKA